MTPNQTLTITQATYKTKNLKRIVIAIVFLFILVLVIGAGIIYFRSLPDYREYKIDINSNSALIVHSSLDWKKEGEEPSKLIPILSIIGKTNNDLATGFSLIRSQPKGVRAWMENLFTGSKRILPTADQSVISCEQMPVNDAISPTQVRDKDQYSMQKMVDRYIGIGAFDTTISKGQGVNGYPWMSTKDVVPKRFKSKRPNDSELSQIIFTLYAHSSDGRRNLKIRINALYDSKREGEMESELRKMAESIRIVPTNKGTSESPEVKGSH